MSRAARRPPRQPDRKHQSDFLWILLVAILVYANSLSNQLVYDDLELIPHQAALRHPGRIAAIMDGLYWGDLRENDVLYRPFTIWTLALNDRGNQALGRGAEDPTGFRVTNIALHAAAACLMLTFLRRLGLARAPALAASLLFAAHPIHSEVVDAIVNRSESLALVCGLAFLILHRDTARPVVARTAAAMLCLFLSLCSKESAVAFLGLVVWMDVLFQRKAMRARIPAYVAYALTAAGWFAFRASATWEVEQRTLSLDNPLVDVSLPARLLTAAGVQARYLVLQLWPDHLSSDYAFNQVPVINEPWNPWFLAFLAAAIGLLLIAWRLRASHPFVSFAVGAYAILLLPASNALFPIGTIMAERLVYSPSVFSCLLLAYAITHVPPHARRVALAGLGIVLVLFSARTIVRNRTWKTPDLFYATQVRTAPRSAKAHYSWGKRLLLAGRLDDAIAENRRAVEIFPNYPDAWNNLAAAYEKKGDLGTAEAMYRRTLDLYPGHAQAHFNLGRLLQERGDYPAAMDAYRAALRLDGRYLDAYNNLGILYAETGRVAEAADAWRRALSVDPGFAPAKENLELLQENKPPRE